MHKTTAKRVSVWSFDKRGPDMERLGQSAKDRTLEVMKNEVRRVSPEYNIAPQSTVLGNVFESTATPFYPWCAR